MWRGAPRLLFALAFVANCLLWSQSRYAQPASAPAHSLFKRSLPAPRWGSGRVLAHSNVTTLYEDQCHPISLPVKDQCTNVMEECPAPHTFLSIPYVQQYFCAKPAVRPTLFAGYLLWLLFLFSTLGISASDFFCPNLATLAHLLRLDENVAGVTFLAFGNGSPDVFSTFSAMRSNSGGLAIGELLGAAAFVTSCVVGSMCIIKPFKVNRGPFLRDVGFFTISVIGILVVLWDSKLELWEALALVGLYLFYVTVVVVGSWYDRRMERKRRSEEMMRDEYRQDTPLIQEPYQDEPGPLETNSSTLEVPYQRTRAVSAPHPPRLDIPLPHRPSTRDSSPHSTRTTRTQTSTPHASHMPSFSLIGALEFRRVVSSLQEQAAGTRLSLFENSPLTPYPGGHYYHHSQPHLRRSSSSRSQHSIPGEEYRDPWDAALRSHGVPLEQRSPRDSMDLEGGMDNMPIPTISHTPASPSITTDSEPEQYIPPTRRQRFMRTLGVAFHVVFPTLQNFRHKSFLGMVVSVFAAPAVMVLTLTLPVVVTNHDSPGSPAEKLEDTGRLVDFEEEGVERALTAEDVVEDEMHELQFNKWLMAVQCVLAPLFCVAILFDGNSKEPWLLLAAGIAGAATAILVAVFSGTGETQGARLARCTMGFIVAMVWIMAIADEVVEVLQTFGLIFGLSDAIIGITIFAMGNSLADLVANMSVAVFAPIMGFSACFGGPMLNILLGVGITGTYITHQSSESYPLEFSTTLLITGVGLLMLLLATLIFVPLNGYFLPRTWGIALIVGYTCLMIANVVVEVKTSGATL
ncbi:sodium/calcium exchanger protein-domain-containing protein [Phanerochaete sordida]|uniref:Sodium/calcium exchanger protein-domain-containing protein n=1 Tax=Phanerochaete sordida TaxID=48140 RepID=A0A9P3GQI2_9APHY|nr:sodium/calcium exchanger protein-domain-containing protein [Phanerochaete sordida]